jgi:hypothetical protein
MVFCRERVILVPRGANLEAFIRALEAALRTGSSVEWMT